MKISDEKRREVAQKLRASSGYLEEVVRKDPLNVSKNAYDVFDRILECIDCGCKDPFGYLADLIDRPIREDFSDNEHSNVVDNLSLLINPVGACRLTAEQQLEALKDAIGCSEGQDWQDQTWVERLIELIDRPTCKNIYAETVTVRACENGFMCSKCGNVIEDCEGYYVNGTFNYCSKC